MHLIDILSLYAPGVAQGKVKLVRHADARCDLDLLVRSGHFEEYQAHQARPIFDCEQIVSFMGEQGTRSRFIGAFDVAGSSTTVPPYPAGFPFPEMPVGTIRYDLVRRSEFKELENRLIIDWGDGTRSWVQWLKPKTVIEILPEGHVRDFPGYEDVLLTFAELERVVLNPDANRVWHTMLKSSAGVYLITDSESGDQYVGSAYGAEGILGRWSGYVKTKHGGNQRLRALLAEHPHRHRAFLFSILRTLPRSMTDAEVIAVEGLFKKKLGTRAFGLNGN